MKKIAILLVLALAGSGFAQTFCTDQGSMELAGSVAFTKSSGDLYENADGDGITAFGINPAVGYFVIPGLEIGGQLLISKESQGDDSQSQFGIGPGFTYYIGGARKKTTYPFVTAAFMITSSSYKTTVSELMIKKAAAKTSESKYSGTSIELGGGILHMLSKAVGLNVQVMYAMNGSKHEDADKATKGSELSIWAGISAFVF
jgi:hypothetical protein